MAVAMIGHTVAYRGYSRVALYWVALADSIAARIAVVVAMMEEYKRQTGFARRVVMTVTVVTMV